MKRIIKFSLLAVVLVLLVSCAITRAPSRDQFAHTKEVADQVGAALILQEGDVTAASIAIMYEGDVIYSRGFGTRDLENDLPVDAHTRFNIGSVSKIFTAASILLLQEDGLLSLDDPVYTLLPSFVMEDQRYRQITVRMLLNHSSGLPGTYWPGGFSSESATNAYVEETMHALASSSLKHDPGAFAPYCNDGFTVAQALIEHLAGCSFSTFVTERIFQRLGMVDSSAAFNPDEENMAYRYEGRTARLPKEYVNIMGSGGLTSTAEDLLRYTAMFFSTELLDRASIAEYLSPQPPAYAQGSPLLDPLLSFGLGWDVTSWQPYESAQIQVLGKSGGTVEYNTMIYVMPQSRSAVVMMGAGTFDHFNAPLPIVDALLKESGLMASTAAAEGDDPSLPHPLPSGIEEYSGYYHTGNTLWRVSFDQEHAMLEGHDGQAFGESIAAHHRGGGVFEDENGAYLSFQTLNGVRSVMHHHKPDLRSAVFMTAIDEPVSAIEHEFESGIWVPLNIPAGDLIMPLYVTSFNADLPGYLILDDCPYLIIDDRHTAMALPTVRDQAVPSLDEEGHLVVYGVVCINADDIPSLTAGEHITLDGKSTVWRRVYGSFSVSVPEGGRLLILDSEFTLEEDTLYSGERTIEMQGDGAYVAFLSGVPTQFKTEAVSTI